MEPQKQIQFDQELRAAIMMACEIETNFKLYSYRCISPEEFIQRNKDLVATFQYSIRQAKPVTKEQENNQLDLEVQAEELSNTKQ